MYPDPQSEADRLALAISESKRLLEESDRLLQKAPTAFGLPDADGETGDS